NRADHTPGSRRPHADGRVYAPTRHRPPGVVLAGAALPDRAAAARRSVSRSGASTAAVRRRRLGGTRPLPGRGILLRQLPSPGRQGQAGAIVAAAPGAGPVKRGPADVHGLALSVAARPAQTV